jgi:FAD binding domain/Berberine and berberine like
MRTVMLDDDRAVRDPASLRARMAGRVVAPGEDGWDEARQAWNLAVDQRPALVALPESAEDVVAVVEFARTKGLHVAAQGTGHAAAPLGPLHDTVLVKTSAMRKVEIDPKARRARVEAGVLWAEASVAAAEHGLAALAGSSPDVGVVGYSLGGGVGWLARRYGLAATSVLAVELVTADGRLVRADGDREPELFWALRGGGGSFGVVTALEFSLYPVREVCAGVLFWPMERASEILHAWARWVEGVPEEVTSVGRLLQFPPIPEISEPLRGRSFVAVEAAYLGSEPEGEEVLRPLRELDPEIDTFTSMTPVELTSVHMDPEQPVPNAGDGMLLTSLPPEAVEALAAAAGPESGSPLVSVELRHLGGALGRPPEGHGALASLDAAFALFAVGIAMSPEMKAAAEAHLGIVQSALAPWDAGRTCMNFTERRVDGGKLFAQETYDRLRMVKARYDREDVFRSNHPIPPAC